MRYSSESKKEHRKNILNKITIKNKKENKGEKVITMGLKNSRRVILPLKRSLMSWFEEFKKLDKVTEFNTEYESARLMVDYPNGNYTTPTRDLSSQKSTYEDYYKQGYSINEIAELFKVSKQYVDTMVSQNTELKEINVKTRSKIKHDIEYNLYVKVPEEYGFEKMAEIGYDSNQYILRRKYKEYGGKQIKSLSEIKEENVNKVWEDFNKGMTYKELSAKYNKKINTISNYIREKRLEETVKEEK